MVSTTNNNRNTRRRKSAAAGSTPIHSSSERWKRAAALTSTTVGVGVAVLLSMMIVVQVHSFAVIVTRTNKIRAGTSSPPSSFLQSNTDHVAEFMRNASSAFSTSLVSPSSTARAARPPCYWKPNGGGGDTEEESQLSTFRTLETSARTQTKSRLPRSPRWLQRKHLDDLKVGDRLDCSHVVQELLEGKTGPKVFVECGVGRTSKRKKKNHRQGKLKSNKGDVDDESSSDKDCTYDESWSIVYGMIRLGPKGMKSSVIRKRVAKLKSRDSFPVWVTRIQRGSAWLEVCAREDDLQPYLMEEQQPKKVPVMSLQTQQEVNGTVVKVWPYGVTVDVGANKRGLLHIRKIASLYNKFIDQEQGIIDAGLPKGTKVRLQVESIDSRRLFLDFTDDVKIEAENEIMRIKEKKKQQQKEMMKKKETELSPKQSTNDDTDPTTSMNALPDSDVSPAVINEYATNVNNGDDDGDDDVDGAEDNYADDDDDDDDDDEDRAIEDAFGLDMY